MKYIALFFVILFSISSIAQDCSKEVLRKKPGSWRAGPQNSANDVSAADLALEKVVVTNIHNMIAARYKPTGCVAESNKVFGMSKIAGENWIANHYEYGIYVLRYLCDEQSKDKSKSYVDSETPTTVKITTNAIHWLSSLYAASLQADDFRGYLKLTQRPVKKDGYYFMGEERAGYNSPIYEYRWLITYDDVLPFSYVSRKEYLLIQKKRLEKDSNENPSEKQYNDKYLSNINDNLKKPEIELNQPAVCMWNEEQRFEKFVDESTRGSFIAIKPNLAYYHKNLPLSSPQFFTVVYKINKDDAVFEDNISNLEKAVDFAVLRSMLGK